MCHESDHDEGGVVRRISPPERSHLPVPVATVELPTGDVEGGVGQPRPGDGHRSADLIGGQDRGAPEELLQRDRGGVLQVPLDDCPVVSPHAVLPHAEQRGGHDGHDARDVEGPHAGSEDNAEGAHDA